MPSRAHAAQLGLRGFGGVDLPDAAERAAALRWASILRRMSRTLGSVVCSEASAHSDSTAATLRRISRSLGSVVRSAASARSESAAALRSAATLRSISRTLGSVVRSAASAHALAKRRYLERVSMSMMGTSHFLLSLDLRSFARMARNRGSSRHALLRQVNQEAT